ncbi:chemotaxis response regulator protein-glutamate methylesterase [Pilimelia terevasa]|uniref:Protein-glutamate methylesterase/protein-glutamine glutaminase n=1 Tax=Pilimelia terevasa TaxID=53372 RepID=A0A8J3BIS7_9ACTN|nr:chemotaxis-specific protein-glutamate methyltransferase CheB [Pilimelia terevasa]GGK24518.1 chemotaxis response regulator protein-glutamate methylesterase [Pilimelia terevasa]
MSGPGVRVLVVEDSPTVRHVLQEALSADPDIVVVGEAANGIDAVAMCARLRPDVVTMDVVLPGMSGLVATEQIMSRSPTPILVVSGAERSEAFTTYDALAAGAVDVLEKPWGDASDARWGQRLRAAVKLLSRVPVVTRHRPGPAAGAAARPEPAGSRPAPGRAPLPVQVVAVGASTGGPGAVVDLLRALPSSFAAPILLVQHISTHEPFAVAFTDWLGGRTDRRVSYARGGEPVASLAGQVVMAPPDRHLVVSRGVLEVTADAPRHSCRPSVDTLFDSVAREFGGRAAACLLSGMGRDGATGLLAVRRAGGHTYAQDEASCVVYGMPREAVVLGAAAYVLPPQQMSGRLALLPGVTGTAGW